MKMRNYVIYLFIIIIIIVSGASLHHHNSNIKYFNKKVLNQHDCNLISNQLKKWENNNDMRYLNNPDNTHFFITDDDTILISYLHVTKQDDAKHYINYVYTNENYRNKGYMRKLLSYTLNICKMHNIHTVYSWTTIDNVKSQNLFLSNNFDIVNIERSHVITFMKHL